MPLRVAEKEGFLYAVNRCCDCPFLINYGSDSMRDKTLLRCSYQEGKKEDLMPNSIPVWCPLPRDEGDGKITVTGYKIKPLPNEHSHSSLDREYR